MSFQTNGWESLIFYNFSLEVKNVPYTFLDLRHLYDKLVHTIHPSSNPYFQNVPFYGVLCPFLKRSLISETQPCWSNTIVTITEVSRQCLKTNPNLSVHTVQTFTSVKKVWKLMLLLHIPKSRRELDPKSLLSALSVKKPMAQNKDWEIML